MKTPMPTIATLLVALAFATTAYAVPVETSTALNLRTGPGVRYAVMATMPRGEVVELEGCEGSWCRVYFRGVRGWASGRYLIRIPFRPAPREGFLSRLFQPDRPEPVAPDHRRARPVAPPPAPTEKPREPTRRSQQPAERAPATPAPGILGEAAPTVRVPLPDEVPQAEPREAESAVRPPGRAAQQPATQAPATGSTNADDATDPPPTRLRREGASGSDVL